MADHECGRSARELGGSHSGTFPTLTLSHVADAAFFLQLRRNTFGDASVFTRAAIARVKIGSSQTTLSLPTGQTIGSRTNPPFAGAAFAHAENARICGTAFLTAQHISLKRPFKCFDCGRSQTDLWLLTVATDEPRTLLPFIDLDQNACPHGKVISKCGAFTFQPRHVF